MQIDSYARSGVKDLLITFSLDNMICIRIPIVYKWKISRTYFEIENIMTRINNNATGEDMNYSLYSTGILINTQRHGNYYHKLDDIKKVYSFI